MFDAAAMLPSIRSRLQDAEDSFGLSFDAISTMVRSLVGELLPSGQFPDVKDGWHQLKPAVMLRGLLRGGLAAPGRDLYPPLAATVTYLAGELRRFQPGNSLGEDVWDTAQISLALHAAGEIDAGAAFAAFVEEQWHEEYERITANPNQWTSPAHLAAMLDVLVAYRPDSAQVTPLLTRLLASADDAGAFRGVRTPLDPDTARWSTSLVVTTLATLPDRHRSATVTTSIATAARWLLVECGDGARWNDWHPTRSAEGMYVGRGLQALVLAAARVDDRGPLDVAVRMGNRFLAASQLDQLSVKARTVLVDYFATVNVALPATLSATVASVISSAPPSSAPSESSAGAVAADLDQRSDATSPSEVQAAPPVDVDPAPPVDADPAPPPSAPPAEVDVRTGYEVLRSAWREPRTLARYVNGGLSLLQLTSIALVFALAAGVLPQLAFDRPRINLQDATYRTDLLLCWLWGAAVLLTLHTLVYLVTPRPRRAVVAAWVAMLVIGGTWILWILRGNEGALETSNPRHIVASVFFAVVSTGIAGYRTWELGSIRWGRQREKKPVILWALLTVVLSVSLFVLSGVVPMSLLDGEVNSVSLNDDHYFFWASVGTLPLVILLFAAGHVAEHVHDFAPAETAAAAFFAVLLGWWAHQGILCAATSVKADGAFFVRVVIGGLLIASLVGHEITKCVRTLRSGAPVLERATPHLTPEKSST